MRDAFFLIRDHPLIEQKRVPWSQAREVVLFMMATQTDIRLEIEHCPRGKVKRDCTHCDQKPDPLTQVDLFDWEPRVSVWAGMTPGAKRMAL